MKEKKSSPAFAKNWSEILRWRTDAAEEGDAHRYIRLLESSVALEKAIISLMTAQAVHIASWLRTPQPKQSFSLLRFIHWVESYRIWLESILAFHSTTYRRWQTLIAHEAFNRFAQSSKLHVEHLAQAQIAAKAAAFELLEATCSFFTSWMIQLHHDEAKQADIERLGNLLLICLHQAEELLRLLSRKGEEWRREGREQELRNDDLPKKQRAFRKALGEWGNVWRTQTLFSTDITTRGKIANRRLAEYAPESAAAHHYVQTAPPAKQPWLHDGVVPGSRKKSPEHRQLRKHANQKKNKDMGWKHE